MVTYKMWDVVIGMICLLHMSVSFPWPYEGLKCCQDVESLDSLKILTKENLERSFILANHCELCHVKEETTNHLFFCLPISHICGVCVWTIPETRKAMSFNRV